MSNSDWIIVSSDKTTKVLAVNIPNGCLVRVVTDTRHIADMPFGEYSERGYLSESVTYAQGVEVVGIDQGASDTKWGRLRRIGMCDMKVDN